MEYELKTVHNYGAFSDKDLNNLAQFGWRFKSLGVNQVQNRTHPDFYYIFEREVK